MKRGEDWLREACTQAAQEETDQWERGLTRTELREAEEVYRHHRRKVLSLIRRETRGKSPSRMWLRIAAALAVLAGAVYLSLRQPPPDTVPQTHLSGVTAAPYYSPAPTSSLNPTTIWKYSPTLMPEFSEFSTVLPTDMPFAEPTSTVIPTVKPTIQTTAEPTPGPTATPTAEPTYAPTATPAATPTPAPIIEPTATPVPESGSEHLTPPESWTGSFFPMGLLYEDAAPDVTKGEGWQQVSSGEWVFTEYTDDRVLDVPPDAALSYVQWEDTVALRAETDENVILIWVQDGHSLRLFSTVEDVLEIAKTVKKVSGE
ncbi:MAG: hypothetical protein IKN04_04565 [Clostridia bacterium]|nr:hypothetical protein [Clostridia bacterium]